MKIRKWICKKIGHSLSKPIGEILIRMWMLEVRNGVKSDINLQCLRCKQKFSIQKIYNLTHDGTERSIEDVMKLSEVE